MYQTAKKHSACLLTSLAVLLAANAVLAEKIDCSGSKKSMKEISNQAIKPGDRPDREMVQFVRLDVISSKNPEFDGAEQTVYGHLDHIGATGTHTGYAVVTLKSGEKLWNKWEGTHYLVPKGGDAWELPYLGVFRYIAGTGSTEGFAVLATTREW